MHLQLIAPCLRLLFRSGVSERVHKLRISAYTSQSEFDYASNPIKLSHKPGIIGMRTNVVQLGRAPTAHCCHRRACPRRRPNAPSGFRTRLHTKGSAPRVAREQWQLVATAGTPEHVPTDLLPCKGGRKRICALIGDEA